ncbi:ATP-binding protein [uncultured Prevotella sp.]|uniref:ATP-binding protein n=1 Tax=uncultured Prevotella sp. TaxID=159272 RepID=UPI0025F54F7A|nr:ATP-binding protein [uncultured Prevotella sp.]
MAIRQYPLGIQTFSEIINKKMLYIDKTAYIYNIAASGKYFFLGRPRRFGKSLLVSTMQSYFEGKKQLFRGLAIEKLESEWTEYPVLHFDMSGGKHMDAEQFEQYLGYRLEEEEKKWGIAIHVNGANNRLIELINTAYDKTGKQVVVLVDEYDAPMLDVVHETDCLDKLRNTMRNFYSPLKYCDPKLRFVFLTGITKFSQMSIFSELNNIKNISMDNEYAAICGITEEEMLTQMSDDIDALAQAQGIGREEAISKLKDNYDGYHFSAKSPDMFNPYSLLNCFADNEFNDYWFSSGTPTYLLNMMRKYEVMPTDVITRVEADASEFDAPTENMTTIMPLLYQSGYITIKDYNRAYNYYTLDVPNKEVKVGLTKALIPSYVTRNTLATTNTARRIAQALDKRDMDGALRLLQTFLGNIPYCENTNYEGHYQQLLFVVFSLLTDFLVDVEVHTPNGRVDIVLLTRTDLYLIELKLNKTAQEAMRQIDLKDFRQRFALCGKPVTKVGINFDAEKKTIGNWVIA